MSVRKTFWILCAAVLLLAIPVLSSEAEAQYLAEAIAALGDEPYVVRVAYGELLLNRLDSDRFPDTLPAVLYSMYGGRIPRGKPTESDRRAAATAYRRLRFADGAFFMCKWSEAENTPLMMRSGVRFYDWFFYI